MLPSNNTKDKNKRLEVIRRHEGEELAPYLDTRNNRTVGVGINIDDPAMSKLVPVAVLEGKRNLTPQESSDTYNKAYLIAESDAIKFVTPGTFTTLHPKAKQVLVDMSYNMGYPKLSEFKKMRQALLNGNYAKAAEELMDSKYYRDKDTHDRALENYLILKSLAQGE